MEDDSKTEDNQEKQQTRTQSVYTSPLKQVSYHEYNQHYTNKINSHT